MHVRGTTIEVPVGSASKVSIGKRGKQSFDLTHRYGPSTRKPLMSSGTKSGGSCSVTKQYIEYSENTATEVNQ